MDDPASLECEKGQAFLGCNHRIVIPPKEGIDDSLPGPPSGIRTLPDGSQKTVFESKAQQTDRRTAEAKSGAEKPHWLKDEYHHKKPVGVRYFEYEMCDFWQSCVDRYLELAPKGTKLKDVGTPFIDESTRTCTEFGAPETPERAAALLKQQCEIGGDNELGPIASKCLMKCLYGARVCRFDLLRPICALASKVTKWDRVCDAKLHRLMCYIKSTKDVMMYGKIGDYPEDLRLALFSDADFAGCNET